jgi:hypothetical protein
VHRLYGERGVQRLFEHGFVHRRLFERGELPRLLGQRGMQQGLRQRSLRRVHGERRVQAARPVYGKQAVRSVEQQLCGAGSRTLPGLVTQQGLLEPPGRPGPGRAEGARIPHGRLHRRLPPRRDRRAAVHRRDLRSAEQVRHRQ